jgi:hypothetical protein
MTDRAPLLALLTLVLAGCGGDDRDPAPPAGIHSFMQVKDGVAEGVEIQLVLQGVEIDVYPNVSYQTQGVWYDLGPGEKSPATLEGASDVRLDGHSVRVEAGELYVGDVGFGPVAVGNAVRTTADRRVEVDGEDRGELPPYRAPE